MTSNPSDHSNTTKNRACLVRKGKKISAGSTNECEAKPEFGVRQEQKTQIEQRSRNSNSVMSADVLYRTQRESQEEGKLSRTSLSDNRPTNCLRLIKEKEPCHGRRQKCAFHLHHPSPSLAF